MFEAYGPKSGIATNSLWFSFLRTGEKETESSLQDCGRGLENPVCLF